MTMKMYVANSTGGLMLQTMLYLANQTSRAAVKTLMDLPPAPKSDINEVRCYGVYGCFPINGPWTTVTRQINVHPQKPADIAPTFTAYTTPAFDRPLLLDLNDADSVRRADIANVAGGGRVFVLAHGYLESGEMPWMLEMGKTLLTKEPPGRAVVILVDWGHGSSPPYVQAVANIRLVGAITAHVIHMLYEELGLPDVRNVHMIGHSLGAHLAGYAGYHLQRDFGLKVGRITGLDPAAPLFSETDTIVRLDRDDAHYVDIIHTDASPLIKGGLGIHQRVGHVDFYPNGGFDNPGCDVRLQEYMRNRKTSLLATMQQFLGCNHIRSYQFFIESITSACPFMGIACDSFEDFAAGKCMRCSHDGDDGHDGHDGHHCIRMGYHSIEDYERLRNEGGAIDASRPLVLYLMTGERRPFCRIHYKLTVRIAGHDESNLHGGEIGSLSVQLHGAGPRSVSGDRMPFSDKPMYFEPGCEYSALVPGKDLHEPAYASVYWEYQTNLLNPLTWRIHASPRIFLDYVRVQSLESDVDLKLCPQHQNAILSGTRNILRSAHCPAP